MIREAANVRTRCRSYVADGGRRLAIEADTSEMGRALARRDETSGVVVLLRQEVDALRTELAELHERLDFSERALAALDRPVRQHVELPKHPTPPEPVHG